jgi:hypothetical protein
MVSRLAGALFDRYAWVDAEVSNFFGLQNKPARHEAMWVQEPSDDFRRQHRWFEKKRPKELRAMLVNLDAYLAALVAGTKPLQIKFGFMHAELRGVVAIDQKGGGKGLAQTRLYVYPDVDDQKLYLLTIGDKNTQKDDIKLCKRLVKQLTENKPTQDDAAQNHTEESHENET